jgi:hypothetical protein
MTAFRDCWGIIIMQRYKYLTSTILCTLILNACGDKGADETNPFPTATLGPNFRLFHIKLVWLFKY